MEVKAFLVHLRLHYQFFILSGAFLTGAVFAGGVHAWRFPIQFLNVHVLLFGGVTVYNSYWDKDTGPIGGLRAPPPLAPWTLPAAWLLQAAGLGIAWGISPASGAVYAASALFFWLYSRPGIRWKGRPWLSLAAIGISTGLCGFLLGYLHAGDRKWAGEAALAAAGVAFIIVSLFPLSQVYQVGEDLERRDRTFTAQYGLPGVQGIFKLLFSLGIAALSLSLAILDYRLGGLFLAVGALVGVVVWRRIRNLELSPGEYGRVMGIKYGASLLFVTFLAAVLGLQGLGAFSR
jgi:hypothetical protein